MAAGATFFTGQEMAQENGSGGYLTTHVLDTAHGLPAAGVRITLFRLEADSRVNMATMTTNHDGRTDTPIIAKGELAAAHYELVFEVGAYFAGKGVSDEGLAFLDSVPVRFAIADPGEHYHVPLLVSPYGYSTYRGS